jgi:hypothetical protein
MSQPDAALYIQVPMLATTVAIQTTVKVVWRKAIQGEARPSPAVGAGLSSELVMRLTTKDRRSAVALTGRPGRDRAAAQADCSP